MKRCAVKFSTKWYIPLCLSNVYHFLEMYRICLAKSWALSKYNDFWFFSNAILFAVSQSLLLIFHFNGWLRLSLWYSRATYQRSKQAIEPACLRQAQAVIFTPVTGQAGQAKSLFRLDRPLKIDMPPACRILYDFQ
jgi:hypothetical protein